MKTHPLNPNLLSLEQAEEVLGPYLNDLHRCTVEAWQKWLSLKDKDPEFYSEASDRTRASSVYDRFKAAAKRIFGDREEEGIYFIDKKLWFLLTIGNVTIRFKKLDGELRPRNVATHQQESFLYNESLPGIPPTTYLTLGYVLDALKTNIASIQITRQYGKNIVWSLPLEQSSNTLEQLPVFNEEPAPTTVRRVKPKLAQAENASTRVSRIKQDKAKQQDNEQATTTAEGE